MLTTGFGCICIVLHELRINRYFKPNKKGAVKCSEQAMALLNTPGGRNLAALINQHANGLDLQSIES